jgi:uncharacterized ferritin-like protein (DUF455 family)
VNPAAFERVRQARDDTGARILERILDDEIRHVGFGTKHFRETSLARDGMLWELWQNLVHGHFRGALKPPFNDSARLAGGLPLDWYGGIA